MKLLFARGEKFPELEIRDKGNGVIYTRKGIFTGKDAARNSANIFSITIKRPRPYHAKCIEQFSTQRQARARVHRKPPSSIWLRLKTHLLRFKSLRVHIQRNPRAYIPFP